MRLFSVVSTRPQFIKAKPVIEELEKGKIEHLLVHTGQHYDYNMSKVFFDELHIPEPDYHLGVGSGNHGWQTGEMVKKLEEVLLEEKPDWVLVYGDTNSTLAGALAASKLCIPIAHVEAGLRSYNRRMPEEINRVLTDHVSTVLLCPTETAVENLKKEGFVNIVNDGKLVNTRSQLNQIKFLRESFVINLGDVMYESLLKCIGIANKRSDILKTYNLLPKSYYLLTVHRAENTDNPERLKNIVEALIDISKDKPVIWPVHPRTRKCISSFNIDIKPTSHFHYIEPAGYFDMLMLEKNACKILTDSGGVQKEAFILNTPCITLREETEWKETLGGGWNMLVGADKEKIIDAVRNSQPIKNHKLQSVYGDTNVAKKIVDVLQIVIQEN